MATVNLCVRQLQLMPAHRRALNSNCEHSVETAAACMGRNGKFEKCITKFVHAICVRMLYDALLYCGMALDRTASRAQLFAIREFPKSNYFAHAREQSLEIRCTLFSAHHRHVA